VSESDGGSGAPDSCAAVNNCFLALLRLQKHEQEDFEHAHEGLERAVCGYAVVRPARVVQLPNFSVLNAQLLIAYLEFAQEQAIGELDSWACVLDAHTKCT